MWLIWAALIARAVYIGNLPVNDEPTNMKEVHDLKVYGPQKKRVATWERKEAIKFGLEEVSSTINYLFIAAAALLSLVGKIAIDPLFSKEQPEALDKWVALLLRHTAIGCLISIAAGFIARSSFNTVADSESFTIYGPVGAEAQCQLFTFGAAALLMIIALSLLMRGREKREEVKP